MKPYLLDVNLLVALLWPAHKHHPTAQRWFVARSRAIWSTCPITQCGFVRLVSNPSFSRDALSPLAASEYLATNLAHARHRFLPDAIPFAAAVAPLGNKIQGHQQVTDTYLFGLALHHDARLATLDKAILGLAPANSPEHASLEIVGSS